MEQIRFDYSMKNIAIPSQLDYLKKLISMSENLCRRMRWRAFFHLNPEITQEEKETYGFNSRKAPPYVTQLATFEHRLQELIANIKFRQVRCSFQTRLSEDINMINASEKLIVPADKTTNFYRLKSDQYKELLHRAVTKDYKETSEETTLSITRKDKSTANKLGLDDRIARTAEKEAFITLKDHKNNFHNNPTCRLINPMKSEIGKISKHILDRINTDILKNTSANLWRSTQSVTKWFESIQNKKAHSFIVFDIVEFYPSITPDLLNKALDYASCYSPISNEDRDIILQSKNSLLLAQGKRWEKKSSPFDVAMGSFDGAECCELIAIFMISRINTVIGGNFGLYRDDGLGAIKATPRKIDIMKKSLCKLFNEHGLRITVEANQKVVNYLDVTLNLNEEKYSPYMKPNNRILYVNKHSNHPPIVTRNIPAAISRRLSANSSNKAIFDNSIAPYQQALRESGYVSELEYKKPNSDINNQPRAKRRRNITWFNPPYSQSVQTNVAKKFLSMVSNVFTNDHTLHSLFNRNTVKVSYCCMPNMKNVIDNHNKRITTSNTTNNTANARDCNCRQPENCPLEGHCLKSSIIYQACVTTPDNRTESYIGLTEGNFKTRYNNHTASFRNENKRNATELSNHIWSLKDRNIDYTIKWKSIRQARACTSGTGICGLCLTEKYYIIYQSHMASLNSRNELITTCRHARKYFLAYTSC